MSQNNVIGNINSVQTNNNTILRSSRSIFSSSFYFEDFYDERAISRFVNGVKKLVRQSKEYRQYIKNLPNIASGLSHDNILSKIQAGDAAIEFHHYPFDLDSIVRIIMNAHVMRKERFTSFSITNEILELHFKNQIGLIPLTETNHQLAHLGKLFISKKQIFGEWEEFVNSYKDGLSQEDIEKIKKINELTANKVPSDYTGIYK